MTIEERLDALTMHLEITAGMARDNEIKIEKINGSIDKVLTLVEKDAENIRALARIAEMHDHPISGLEGTH